MAKTSMDLAMSEDLKSRLTKCAEMRGQSVEEFAQEALYTYVEDIEDGAMSDVALTEEGLEFLVSEGGIPVGMDRSVLQVGRKTA